MEDDSPQGSGSGSHSLIAGLHDYVERIHTEQKSFRDFQSQTNAAVDKRVARMEWHGEETDKRLGAGAASFSKLELQIEKVNAKIDWPWWKTLATVMPAILLVITWVWQAARYPDDTKFDALKTQVQDLRTEQRVMAEKIDQLVANQRKVLP